jgi:hypothetical protein
VPKIRRRLDVRDRGKPDPGIGNVTGKQLPDLLPQELIYPISALRHAIPFTASSPMPGVQAKAPVRNGASARERA